MSSALHVVSGTAEDRPAGSGPGETAPDDLEAHPDRLRWNEKHAAAPARFEPHPVAGEVLFRPVPAGPILEIACGVAGTGLALAAEGRRVVLLDVSDVALRLQLDEARRRGLADRLSLVHADASRGLPGEERFAAVLATLYWDAEAFRAACKVVAPGGLLLWETFTLRHLAHQPTFRPAWCLADGEPASLLPASFRVELLVDLETEDSSTRRMVARRSP